MNTFAPARPMPGDPGGCAHVWAAGRTNFWRCGKPHGITRGGHGLTVMGARAMPSHPRPRAGMVAPLFCDRGDMVRGEIPRRAECSGLMKHRTIQ